MKKFFDNLVKSLGLRKASSPATTSHEDKATSAATDFVTENTARASENAVPDMPTTSSSKVSMHCETLTLSLEAKKFRFGQPQTSGAMTVLPIFGPDHGDRYSYPQSGLKLSRVKGYGNVELSNGAAAGVAIVPLHMGYIQDQAQNHALCRSTFIGAGQKVMLEDACCVQQSQGGYLQEKDQWFFILPVGLREEALQLRGRKDYQKLWKAISKLNSEFGLESRGHLEQILSRQRPFLTQYQTRFELLPEQTGAAFFVGERLVGIELAPSANYFRELWMPLVCFCYGSEAMREERSWEFAPSRPTFECNNLAELRQKLIDSRAATERDIWRLVETMFAQSLTKSEEERYLSLRLSTLDGTGFTGQIVEDSGTLLYASIFAKRDHLRNGN